MERRVSRANTGMQVVNDIRTSAEDTPGTLVPCDAAGEAHRTRELHLPSGPHHSSRERKAHIEMKKHLAVIGALFVAVFLGMTPALAAAATVLTIDNATVPIPSAADNNLATVNLTYSGLPTGKRLFFEQCFLPTTDPTFDPTASCSLFSEVTTDPGANTTGSGTLAFQVFHGKEPSGDDRWGCYATNETPPANVTAYNTCYIRVTDDSEANTTDQKSVAFSFAAGTGGGGNPPPDVPESSLPIALPLVGVAVVGASLVAMRRRRTRAVV